MVMRATEGVDETGSGEPRHDCYSYNADQRGAYLGATSLTSSI